MLAFLCAAAAAAVTATVDFSADAGRIKPLHGVNNSPVRLAGRGGRQTEFAAAGIPFVRLHDACGAFGGAHYVDVENIFTDMSRDENDPASYDFAFTDAYLKPLVEAGCRIFYRLGCTIENNYTIRSYHNRPPADFAKYARVCEHIVRHYNEGWADGFRWGIAYWEIWNEPEGKSNWNGTRDQFFEFYRTVACHLKRCFPDIKVGGYGSIGFYAIDNPKQAEKAIFRKSVEEWFRPFVRYVTADATKAPLDFFSWHFYLHGPACVDRVVAHAEFVRRTLDAAGLTAAESVFGEWNCKRSGDWSLMKEMPAAAPLAECLCRMQTAPVDIALYYDAFPQRVYCGLFYFPNETVTPTYHVFRLWNELYRLGGAKFTSCARPRFGTAAASDGARRAVMLVNDSRDALAVRIGFPGGGGEGLETLRLDERHRSGEVVGRFDPARPLEMPPESIVLLRTPHRDAPIEKAQDSHNFGGLSVPVTP